MCEALTASHNTFVYQVLIKTRAEFLPNRVHKLHVPCRDWFGFWHKSNHTLVCVPDHIILHRPIIPTGPNAVHCFDQGITLSVDILNDAWVRVIVVQNDTPFPDKLLIDIRNWLYCLGVLECRRMLMEVWWRADGGLMEGSHRRLWYRSEGDTFCFFPSGFFYLSSTVFFSDLSLFSSVGRHSLSALSHFFFCNALFPSGDTLRICPGLFSFPLWISVILL